MVLILSGVNYVKTCIVGLLLGVAAAAQPALVLSSNSPTTPPNKPITFTVTLSGSAGSNISALEFALPFPNSSLTSTTTLTNKTLTCNSNTTLCLLYGLNSTALADGAIASFTWTPLSQGSFTYNISNITAATSAGASATAIAGAAFSLTITSPCDINGDGKIDVNDLTAYITTYVFPSGGAPPTSPIGSGFAIVDLQRIAIASATGTCTTGK